MGTDRIGWKRLGDSLRDRTLVPIFGPDAALVTREGRTAPFHHFLAEGLRAAWEASGEALPAVARPGLWPLVRAVLARPENLERNRDVIMARLRASLVEAHQRLLGEVAPAPAMRAIEVLGALPVWVTTAIDGGLDVAMKLARIEEPSRLNVKRITTRTAEDLPAGWEGAAVPAVYHLFGRIDGEMTFALGDDEVIEAFYKLHGAQAPARLVTALADHDKLLLGTGLPDWLFRFLFRLAKGRPYTDRPLDTFEVVAEDQLRTESPFHDGDLLGFLRQFPGGTWIAADDAAQFLLRLTEHVVTLPPPAPRPAAGRRPPGHVFISYSFDDQAFAEALAHRLETRCQVWLDRQRLQGGEELTVELRAAIEDAHLFVPLISRRTNASAGRKVFVEEWKHALEWVEGIQLGLRPYIVPVIIDDLPLEALAGEAAKFTHKLDLTFRRATADGASLDELVDDLVGNYQKVELALHKLPTAS